MPNLLRTVTHEKLQKGFSHPTSTEKLSEALEGVPQFSEITLRFDSHEGKVLGENHRLHGAVAKKLESYRLFLECSWGEEEGWGIEVFAVPGERKAKISAACAELAFPALREWFCASRPDSWFLGRRYFQVAVSEFTDELALQEIHNDRVEFQRELLR
jgi:hypothetical protein